MKTPNNYYLVEPPDSGTWENIKTGSGLELYAPRETYVTSDNKTQSENWHKRTWGIVTAVPGRLKKTSHAYKSVVNSFGSDDFTLDIEIGDKIFFNYLTYLEDPFIVNGKYCWRVGFDQIYAVKRGSDLMAVCDKVLAKEIKVTADLGSLINPIEEVLESKVEVTHVPPNWSEGIKPGDVVYHKDKAVPYDFDGERYMVLECEQILALDDQTTPEA